VNAAVVNVASTSRLLGAVGQSNYGAAKAGRSEPDPLGVLLQHVSVAAKLRPAAATMAWPRSVRPKRARNRGESA
jgi:hypothetical protein